MNNTKALSALNYLAVAFMMTAAAAGIFDHTVYARESASWASQGIGQDFVNLFLISPAILTVFQLAKKGNIAAYLTWLGLILYVVYSYILYCFAMHFNRYFLVYCAAFGSSCFAFLLAFKDTGYETVKKSFKGAEFKFIPWTLIVIAAAFGTLWLKEVIPSIINNTVPGSVTEAGLMINPVHVNDLSLFLPAFIISAVLLLRKKAEGYVFVPAMLAFSAAMNLAILGMAVSMNIKGTAHGYGAAYPIGLFAVLSVAILAFMLKKIRQ